MSSQVSRAAWDPSKQEQQRYAPPAQCKCITVFMNRSMFVCPHEPLEERGGGRRLEKGLS